MIGQTQERGHDVHSCGNEIATPKPESFMAPLMMFSLILSKK